MISTRHWFYPPSAQGFCKTGNLVLGHKTVFLMAFRLSSLLCGMSCPLCHQGRQSQSCKKQQRLLFLARRTRYFLQDTVVSSRITRYLLFLCCFLQDTRRYPGQLTQSSFLLSFNKGSSQIQFCTKSLARKGG